MPGEGRRSQPAGAVGSITPSAMLNLLGGPLGTFVLVVLCDELVLARQKRLPDEIVKGEGIVVLIVGPTGCPYESLALQRRDGRAVHVGVEGRRALAQAVRDVADLQRWSRPARARVSASACCSSFSLRRTARRADSRDCLRSSRSGTSNRSTMPTKDKTENTTHTAITMGRTIGPNTPRSSIPSWSRRSSAPDERAIPSIALRGSFRASSHFASGSIIVQIITASCSGRALAIYLSSGGGFCLAYSWLDLGYPSLALTGAGLAHFSTSSPSASFSTRRSSTTSASSHGLCPQLIRPRSSCAGYGGSCGWL